MPPRTPAPNQSRELTPRQVATLVYPAVVAIYTGTSEGDVYLGSGFLVGPGKIATCYHVVEDASVILVKSLGDGEPIGSLKKAVRGRVIAKDVDRDLAVVSAPGLAGKPLQLFKGEDMYVGETVYTVGNPEGQEGTFSSGMTSNFQMTKDPLTFHVQFTVPVSPGSSGGPLVNSRGEVIGIIDTQLNVGQNLNFAVAAAHLRSLLDGREINGYLDNKMTPQDEQ